MPKREKIASLLALTLAITAVTATPEAHADLARDFGKDLERAVRGAGIDAVNTTIREATPQSAKRAALGLPGQRYTVTDTVIGRVMQDASRSTYGMYGAERSSLKVPGLPGRGSLPGRSTSLGNSVKDSVKDVASDTVRDGIQDVTSKSVSKVLGAIFNRDDSPSP